MNEKAWLEWINKLPKTIEKFTDSKEELDFIVYWFTHIKGSKEGDLVETYNDVLEKHNISFSNFNDILCKNAFNREVFGDDVNKMCEVGLNARLWYYLPLLRLKFKREKEQILKWLYL